MGRPADARVAGAVPARGVLRGAGRAGKRRPGGAARGTRRRPAPGDVPRPGRRRADRRHRVHRRRRGRRHRDQADPAAPARVRRRHRVRRGRRHAQLGRDQGGRAAERATGDGPASALDGVPFGQPALALAAQLQRRAERAGIAPDLAVPGGPGERQPASARSCSRWWPGPGGGPRPRARAARRRPRATRDQVRALGSRTSGSDQAGPTERGPGPAWPVPSAAALH